MTNEQKSVEKESRAKEKVVDEIKQAEAKAPSAVLTENVTRKLSFIGGILLVGIVVSSAAYLIASENYKFDSNGERIKYPQVIEDTLITDTN